MKTPKFEEVPQCIAEILANQETILSLLSLKAIEQEPEKDKLLTVSELKLFLPENPATQTIYGWVFMRQIPFEKHGKRLYFRKSKVKQWLDEGRQMKYIKE